MPVLSEPTAKERKRGRGWLWLLAAPVLLVLFAVGTTARPLVVEAGGVVVQVGGARMNRLSRMLERAGREDGALPELEVWERSRRNAIG